MVSDDFNENRKGTCPKRNHRRGRKRKGGGGGPSRRLPPTVGAVDAGRRGTNSWGGVHITTQGCPSSRGSSRHKPTGCAMWWIPSEGTWAWRPRWEISGNHTDGTHDGQVLLGLVHVFSTWTTKGPSVCGPRYAERVWGGPAHDPPVAVFAGLLHRVHRLPPTRESR